MLLHVHREHFFVGAAFATSLPWTFGNASSAKITRDCDDMCKKNLPLAVSQRLTGRLRWLALLLLPVAAVCNCAAPSPNGAHVNARWTATTLSPALHKPRRALEGRQLVKIALQAYATLQQLALAAPRDLTYPCFSARLVLNVLDNQPASQCCPQLCAVWMLVLSKSRGTGSEDAAS
eukprot:6189447-Pleurochrysis_carterae.AAC.5